jgi:glycosyltransferase involved in cell wall biosynthesis
VPDAPLRPGPIRVLHVITNLGIGGAERLVVSAARRLPRDRFESVVCCLTDLGPLAREVEADGVAVHCVNAFPGLSNPLAFIRLVSIIGRVKPTIVHTHLQAPNLYGRLAAYLSRVPIIVATEHNVYTGKARRYIAAERVLARLTSALVAVSSEVQQFLSRQLRLPLARIRVIRNGVAAPQPTADGVAALRKLSTWPAPIGAVPTHLRLATIASLTAKKGHDVLLRALALLAGRGLGVSAMFAGDGPERARLEMVAADLKLGGSVHFLGAVSNPADVLAAADVFVLPSLVEGLPLALLEAMRAGKPVVATSVGGVPEAVSAGINGLLVPPADDVALADAIATLATSPQQRNALGNRARVTADRDFTEESYVAALIRLYDELLAR